MARLKIDYGIDLGTTNSAIARIDNNEVKIIKTKDQTDTLPSLVYFDKNKKGVLSTKVGLKAKNAMRQNTNYLIRGVASEKFGYAEFKRDMGTDKQFSNSNMPKSSYTPEELSAEVIRELLKTVNDDKISACVVTVPAKFTANQKEATMRAAKLAGITQCELLQEPVAACISYGIRASNKNGYWLVFDFGGGTFDAALVKAEDGILTVFDTEGDNYLGGKNLDYAVINNLLIPRISEEFFIDCLIEGESAKSQLFKIVLKDFAEEIRTELSFSDSCDFSSYDRNINICEDDDGNDIEIDITVTQEELSEVVTPIYQKAVDICKDLLSRNNLSGDDLDSVILVGGPTFSPIVRGLLKDQITEKIDTSMDPMTAVAKGAAIYASTIDVLVDDDFANDCSIDTVMLDLCYEPSSVETEEWVAIKLKEETSDIDFLTLKLFRNDNAWTSDSTEINKNGEVIQVALLKNRTNTFTLEAFDSFGNKVNIFPKEFSIIQGAKVGAAPNPYNYAIAIYNPENKKDVILPIKGLEKNKPLPAVGVVSDRKTSSFVKAGSSSSYISIPVYQVDNPGDAAGKSAKYYEHIGDVEILGTDLNEDIPKDSQVEVTLLVDSSETINMKVMFPQSNQVVEKKLDLRPQVMEEVKAQCLEFLEEAKERIIYLDKSDLDVSNLQIYLDQSRSEYISGDIKASLQHVKEVLRKIEDAEGDSELQSLKVELSNEFNALTLCTKLSFSMDTNSKLEKIKSEKIKAENSDDKEYIKHVTGKIRAFIFELSKYEISKDLINRFRDNFDSYSWVDKEKALNILNQGLEIIETGDKDAMLAVARELIFLLPEDQVEEQESLLLK